MSAGTVVESWRAPGQDGSKSLSYFFDRDFNEYCYRVWYRSARADDFGKLFCKKKNFSQLCQALDLRIGEHLAGRTHPYTDGIGEQHIPFALE